MNNEGKEIFVIALLYLIHARIIQIKTHLAH